MSTLNFVISIYLLFSICYAALISPFNLLHTSYFKTTLFLIMLCLLQDTDSLEKEIAGGTNMCLESGELLLINTTV